MKRKKPVHTMEMGSCALLKLCGLLLLSCTSLAYPSRNDDDSSLSDLIAELRSQQVGGKL